MHIIHLFISPVQSDRGGRPELETVGKIICD